MRKAFYLCAAVAALCLTVNAQTRRAHVDINIAGLPGSLQFINQIVRPCASGVVPIASVIVNPNNSGNIDVTPCTGGSLTVNGVAVGGVGGSGTANTVAKFVTANSVGNSRITDNATVIALNGGTGSVGGATFDSGSQFIRFTANATASFQLGTASDNGQSCIGDCTGGGNSTRLLVDNAANSNTLFGRGIVSANGISGFPALLLPGTIFTGGGTTLTKPQFLVEPAGTTSTAWSNLGTLIGANAPSGFTGNLADFQLNGVSKLSIASTGLLLAPNGINTNSTANINLNFGGILLAGATGIITGTGYATSTNCADSAGPAACGSATAGAVVIDAGATTVVVSTTNVTANSEIFVQYDSSLGARLAVTCNTTVALPAVTARTAGTSFTITVPVAPITNPACYSYHIIN